MLAVWLSVWKFVWLFSPAALAWLLSAFRAFLLAAVDATRWPLYTLLWLLTRALARVAFAWLADACYPHRLDQRGVLVALVLAPLPLVVRGDEFS